jgi:hypothetical protein
MSTQKETSTVMGDKEEKLKANAKMFRGTKEGETVEA